MWWNNCARVSTETEIMGKTCRYKGTESKGFLLPLVTNAVLSLHNSLLNCLDHHASHTNFLTLFLCVRCLRQANPLVLWHYWLVYRRCSLHHQPPYVLWQTFVESRVASRIISWLISYNNENSGGDGGILGHYGSFYTRCYVLAWCLSICLSVCLSPLCIVSKQVKYKISCQTSLLAW